MLPHREVSVTRKRSGIRACLDSRPVVLLVLPDLIWDPEIVLMVLFSTTVWIEIAIVLLIK
jgi:hypothetical protein